MTDARFEDGTDQALSLKAESVDDIEVLSALAQDALFSVADARWDKRSRALSFLVNRFRWEDQAAAEREGRPYERVRSLLIVDDVLSVASQGIDRNDKDAILSILSLDWEAGVDGAGWLVITLAGDGAIRVEAECIDLGLIDVTRPYVAPSGHAPHHPG